jgi:hypothetical protein
MLRQTALNIENSCQRHCQAMQLYCIIITLHFALYKLAAHVFAWAFSF